MAIDKGGRTFYDILSLPYRPRNPVSLDDIKHAYRQTLLAHHPDKSGGPLPSIPQADGASSRATRPKPSIDEITLAYKTLISATLRAEYDKSLLVARSKNVLPDGLRGQAFQTGLETVDLDDFTYDKEKNEWARECRCGQMQGYRITERELEAAEKDGEVAVGCYGCSLWLNVVFGVVEGQEEGDGSK